MTDRDKIRAVYWETADSFKKLSESHTIDMRIRDDINHLIDVMEEIMLMEEITGAKKGIDYSQDRLKEE